MNIANRLLRTSKRAVKRALRPLITGSSGSNQRPAPEHWGLTCTPSGALALDGQGLHELGRQWGFPLHIVNAARLRENAARFLAPGARHSGPCETFYSYKTNPVPGVLAILNGLGIGAEVISHYELWLAIQLGVPPERIVFNGPAKSAASLEAAIDAGIQVLNINHREELAAVSAIAKQLRRQPRIGIRITVGDGWAGQFGVPVQNGRALAAYEDAIHSPHLQVVGLHAHRGGMIRSQDELVGFVRPVLAFVEDLHDRLGVSLEILNFGGSLCPPTVHALSATEMRLNRAFRRDLRPPDSRSALSIERYVALLTELVHDCFLRRRWSPPRIFLEPGRALTSDAQMLLASVLTIKQESDVSFAILDAGINLAESCRSEYHALFSANHCDRLADCVYTVVGPICTPGDTLYWAARLPFLEPGDSILIMDAGAYFIPFATSFSFPRPPVVLVDNGQVVLLRRGERFEDLVSYDDMSPLS